MSPSASCSLPPRFTRFWTGAVKLAISTWKAIRLPRVSRPSITRNPPTPEDRGRVDGGQQGGGTAASAWV